MPQLDEYRRKRRFDKTPEPATGKPSPGRNRFVVHKHAARRLHYDFRLEIDGVLVSWAVPKGPSLNPADKRLAVPTEDHPLDYGGFEGVIPAGQYGAGAVMVWDTGTYQMEGDLSASQQLARGELKFILRGRKLRGGFVLVKLKRSEKGNEWLLIKHKDAAADPKWDIEDHDGSALTGRTLTEIAEGLPAAHRPSPGELDGARKAPMPAQVQPMAATLVDKPFSDPGWVFEIKWDGVRALAWIKNGKLTLRSRTGLDITDQYPELGSLPAHFDAAQAILDGEIVALDERGRGDFERLQQRMNTSQPRARLQQKVPVTYYLFDLLYCDGYDLRQSPLIERKRLLRQLLNPIDPFRYSDHQAEHGKELFELAREQNLEGILAKHARSPYVSRRSPYWAKFKVREEIDAVVGGWTEPRGGREHFGALLLGLYKDGKLRFIGSVGTGFTAKTLKEILERLKKLATKTCPFDETPDTKEESHWVKPTLIARVHFVGWTQETRLRQPAFLGFRDDIDPEDCRFEAEAPRPAATVVVAPAVTGKVLRKPAEIERELVEGKAENVHLELDGKAVRLTHLNKVYYPESRYTKRHLLAYYYRMAELVLDYLRDRPLVLRRYPEGIQGESFFQKEAGESHPEWMQTVSIPSEGRKSVIRYFLANDVASLLYLVNLGCIDHNPWASRTDALDQPDWVIFDLDPTNGTPYPATVAVARAVHARLVGLGLQPFIKTSGATGIHLYVPVERVYTYDQARTFAEIVARLVAVDEPDRVTQERSVDKRAKGKVYVDVFQNAAGRPLAAPYCARAFPHAPVSAPVTPEELRSSLRPEQFTIKTMEARLKKKRDLWADFWKKRQRLEEATKYLGEQVGRLKKR
ncbi:MAG TPA: DNA ligase D [Candidatus Xenobia bacterium]|nr:DNA ligase D [Candidatus Xenobia bacterium]